MARKPKWTPRPAIAARLGKAAVPANDINAEDTTYPGYVILDGKEPFCLDDLLKDGASARPRRRRPTAHHRVETKRDLGRS